ncbi:tetratricopeptide repeat protein [Bradyrhizobium genomosp. III]|uniref:tetratricopeptide repeat protein n=1 Tax=Bradyrhizobium genomosp. III TaxID=2683271 RepID=UPI0004B438E8|nr:tetratricopeptide repeat protein [Bradyrhizobium sp. CCBAU 15544]
MVGSAGQQRFTLGLLGPFRLLSPGGERIEIPSKRGVAVIAMLALARDGERTRGWLQDKLWGRRQHAEARGSLRRELSNLRTHLNQGSAPLLVCERDRVKLRLELIEVDVRVTRDNCQAGDFLEGLDIAGEDGFEEWLREQRSALVGSKRIATSQSSTPGARTFAVDQRTTDPVLNHFVDTSHSPFGSNGSPALAVMSFENMTGKSELDYVAEGISEELINGLSRIRWLPVIGRSSSFSFPGNADRTMVGRSLGAKYLLEGRLREEKGTFWINASLVVAESGHTVWSQRFVLPSLTATSSFQELAIELVAHLETRIDHAEQLRTRGKRQDSLTVSDLIWRGRWYLNQLSREGAEQAQRLFAEALTLDPESSEALIQATFCLSWSIWAGRQSTAKILEMRKLAQRAILADCDDGRGHMLAGMAEMWLRKPFPAEELLRKAIDLNPSLALAHAELGSCRTLSGRPDLAIPELAMAMRLSPNDLHIFYPLGEMAMAHCMRGEWKQATEFAERALIRRPGYWYAQMIRITALREGGNHEEARQAFTELMLAKPDFSRRHIEWLPFIDRKWTEYFIGALTAAGKGLASLERFTLA